MRKKNCLITCLFFFVTLLIISLTYYDSSSYVNFEEAINKNVYVIGTLVNKEHIMYNPIKDENHLSFYMKDNKNKIAKVIFLGSKPQDFELSQKIVVVGKMNNNEFYARKILMKCPSKYNEISYNS